MENYAYINEQLYIRFQSPYDPIFLFITICIAIRTTLNLKNKIRSNFKIQILLELYIAWTFVIVTRFQNSKVWPHHVAMYVWVIVTCDVLRNCVCKYKVLRTYRWTVYIVSHPISFLSSPSVTCDNDNVGILICQTSHLTPLRIENEEKSFEDRCWTDTDVTEK